MKQKILSFVKNNYLLIAILFLSALLRFFHLDYQSPWLDEIHTLNEANPNTSFIDVYNQILSGEQMPPLYFYIIYFLFKIFGYSIFVARFFSAVVGVLAVYVLYKLAKELFDKKTALISALLLGLNYFMIYFSQEARPYIFFTLFILLSYHRLVLFIKSDTIKNAIWYGLAASFMLHFHFIGFFTLFAQSITLLLYLFLKKELNKLLFFKRCLIAAVVLIIAFLPSVHSLLKLFKIDSFWIPAPTPDSLKLIYKSFFGNSEIIIFFNSIFFIAFIYAILKNEKDKNIDTLKSNFSIVILILWISLTVLIPVVSSYISNPIILDRYFIAVLPAILILFSIGIMQLKGKVLKMVFISLYFVFFMFDFTGVQNYYNSVKKTQFREATNYIIEKNEKNHKVVSSLSWYLPYFFNQATKNTEIVGATLDEFISQQLVSKDSLFSFWYFDAHGREYNPSPETLAFLNQNYALEDNFSGQHAWTRHFVIKSEIKTKIEFTKEYFAKITSNEDVKFNIEFFDFKDNLLSISGWAFLKNEDSQKTKIKLVLLNNVTGEFIETIEVLRTDVTSYFNLDHNADFSGFKSDVSLQNLPVGEYKIGILLTNKEAKNEALIITDKTVVRI